MTRRCHLKRLRRVRALLATWGNDASTGNEAQGALMSLIACELQRCVSGLLITVLTRITGPPQPIPPSPISLEQSLNTVLGHTQPATG